MTTTVGDVMTRCPVSVPADAPFATVAAVLTHNRVSAVPVVDRDGHPVGVVSEADLIGARQDTAARELMTTPVHVVAEDTPLPAAVRALVDAGVRRLFVTARGRLVGVLSRRDLLATYVIEDDVVRERVERALLPVLSSERNPVAVSVRDGVVLMLGRVEWRSTCAAVDDAVRAVPGVVEVRDRLDFVFDDRLARSRR
jgi:predicted transcriptional regulator